MDVLYLGLSRGGVTESDYPCIHIIYLQFPWQPRVICLLGVWAYVSCILARVVSTISSNRPNRLSALQPAKLIWIPPIHWYPNAADGETSMYISRSLRPRAPSPASQLTICILREQRKVVNKVDILRVYCDSNPVTSTSCHNILYSIICSRFGRFS